MYLTTQPATERPRVETRRFIKIGRPGYRVTKQRNPETFQQSLLFQIDFPEVADGITPRHRFMSAYEQRMEPPDRKWQYLLFAAEPYETIAFKVPSREVDKVRSSFLSLYIQVRICSIIQESILTVLLHLFIYIVFSD